MTGAGAGHRADHEVHRTAPGSRSLAMAVLFFADARHPAALRPGRAGARGRPSERRDRCPSRVHAVVLVSKVHKPTLRALAYARAIAAEHAGGGHRRRRRGRRPHGCCEAVGRRGIPVPLKVLDSPYREITRPIIDYVTDIRRAQPARRGHGLHPGVRRRALVGADAAQPERAAAQGPAAVHARRHGDVSVPFQLHSSEGASTRRARRGAPHASPASTPERGARATATPSATPTGGRRWSARGRGARSGRSRTAGTASPGTRGGSSSSGTRCRGSGSGARSPRAREGDRFLRADAVEVLAASPDRVDAAVPVRRAGRCGGCDFQHVGLDAPARG